MPRSLIFIAVAVVILVLGVVMLSRIDASKPLTPIEKTVPDNALAR